MKGFVKQKRINVCEHTVKMVPRDSFEYEPPGKEQKEGRCGGDGEGNRKEIT